MKAIYFDVWSSPPTQREVEVLKTRGGEAHISCAGNEPQVVYTATLFPLEARERLDELIQRKAMLRRLELEWDAAMIRVRNEYPLKQSQQSKGGAS